MRSMLLRPVLAILLVSPCLAADTDAAAAGDPVVASVLRMLDSGVSPETVAQWLDQVDTPPATPTAGELIALTRAGAPDELVQKILRLAAKSPTRDAERREPTQERAPPSPAPAPPAPPGKRIPVRFEVRYVPGMIEYQAHPWDLFVYVDGRPVVRGDGWAAHDSKHADHRIVEVPLEPGHHVVRLLQEQHLLRSRRKDRWVHRARVFESGLPLDLNSAGDWLVRLRVREGEAFSIGSETAFEVARNGESVDSGTGPGPGAAWPALCEELEYGMTDRERRSKSGRRALEGCVRWSDLWSGVDSAPDRDTVRRELKLAGFEPNPAPR